MRRHGDAETRGIGIHRYLNGGYTEAGSKLSKNNNKYAAGDFDEAGRVDGFC
jgi:hypothetical protein